MNLLCRVEWPFVRPDDLSKADSQNAVMDELGARRFFECGDNGAGNEFNLIGMAEMLKNKKPPGLYPGGVSVDVTS